MECPPLVLIGSVVAATVLVLAALDLAGVPFFTFEAGELTPGFVVDFVSGEPDLGGPGGDATGVRIRDNDAAVGLLRRSAALLLTTAFLGGVEGFGCALRILAKDAAVGADRPVEGVFGRLVVVVVATAGVLGREVLPGVRVGILAAEAGVVGASLETGFRADGVE